MVRRSELIDLLLGAPDAASPRLIDTHVKSIRRKGDGAVVLVGERMEMAIPVSRSALPKLKARLQRAEGPNPTPQAAVLLS